MKRHLVWFLWLLMTLGCEAAEIVAWKVPVTRLADKALESAGVLRCKSAPEASPFFNEGDELWDLKAIMPEDGRTKKKLQLEFLVWNASSGRLIAKGNWMDICVLNDVLRPDEMPSYCQLTIGVYEVPEDGAPTPKNAKPVAQLIQLVQSGAEFEKSWNNDQKSIDTKGSLLADRAASIFDMNLYVSTKVNGHTRLDVNTSFTLQSGSTLWVARDFDGKRGLDLKVTAMGVMSDGSSPFERVSIQNGGKIVSLTSEGEATEMRRVGEVGWFASRWVSPRDLMQYLSPDSKGEEKDPFAELTEEDRTILPLVSSVGPPKFLQPWLNHEILDASGWVEKIMKNIGLEWQNNDRFIGYDQMAELMYFYSPQRSDVEMLEQLFSFGDSFCPSGIVGTLDGNGRTRLVARSGQRATLWRTVGEGSVRRSMEIEPVFDGQHKVINVRLDFLNVTKSQRTIRFKKDVTLNVGEPLELIPGTIGDDKKPPLRLTAEIMRAGRSDED